LKWYVAS
jgi:transcription initiation protein SPT3